MPKYVKASTAADIIGAQLGVPLDEMCEIMGNVPAEDVICSTPEYLQRCDLIAKHYGWNLQKKQAAQECAEMIVELTKRPDQMNDSYSDDLRGEIADCMIMLTQLAIMIDGIDSQKLIRAIDYKLKRQIHRISCEDARNGLSDSDVVK